MKLRSLELADVRRFAGQVARIDGIGDGVSVLAAPNETGKSTLFDALHALMFFKHTAAGKDVQALRPHAGGRPRVAAGVELDGVLYRIEKQWLAGKSARVWDGAGRLLAQADEAEAWITARLGAGLTGPAGLLWVRQGAAGLDAAGTLAARRDILTAVTQEIDALTGGRRMDALRARVEADLGALATDTGRPKAGGPWKAAADALAEAEALRADLTRKADALAEALRRRAALERRRRDLDDPETVRERAERLARARAASDAAQAQAARVAEALQALHLAQAQARAAHGQRDRLRAAAGQAEAAEAARLKAAEARRVAEGEATAAAEGAAGTDARAQAARAKAEVSRAQVAVFARWQAARAAAERSAALAERLARAEAAAVEVRTAEAARAALPVTAARLEALRKAQAACDILQAQAEATAVSVRFDYAGAARARRDGAVVEGVERLVAPAVYDLPGLGQLTVDPGAAARGGDTARRLAEARQALARALADCGAATLAEAAAALAGADGLAQQARSARARIEVLAPQGLAALRAEAAAAGPPEAGAAPEGAEPAEAEVAAAAEAARQAEAAAQRAAEAANRAGAALAAAAATEAAARASAEAAHAALGDPAVHAEALTRAEAEAVTAGLEEDATRARHQRLTAEMPDTEGLRAALTRAQSVVDAAAAEGRQVEGELSELRGRIGALAEAGVDEALAEATDQCAALTERAAAFAAEAAALTRLRRALDDARAAARTAYFEPVVQELSPLLAMVLPGAQLDLSDDTLLPAALIREARVEGVDILSGGTREQIAVLTRLAFARLLARQGRGVPVILDDALVQTDDDRIEAMFTALHRVAEGQQVLVLTCRQRAFAALGGQRLDLRIEPA